MIEDSQNCKRFFTTRVRLISLLLCSPDTYFLTKQIFKAWTQISLLKWFICFIFWSNSSTQIFLGNFFSSIGTVNHSTCTGQVFSSILKRLKKSPYYLWKFCVCDMIIIRYQALKYHISLTLCLGFFPNFGQAVHFSAIT